MDSLHCFSEAIKGESITALIMRGEICFKNGLYAQAISDFIKAENHIKNGGIVSVKHYRLLKIKFKIALDKVNYSKLSIMSSSRDHRPYESNKNNTLKGKYMENGFYNDALKAINQAIIADPKSIDAYMMRGELCKKAQLYQQALFDFSIIIQLHPQNIEAHIERGNIHFLSNQLNKSIEDYDRAIEINHLSATAYNNRGVVKNEIRLFKAAINDLNTAIQIDSNRSDSYASRGMIYLKHFKNNTQACFDFKKACDLGNCIFYNTALEKKICR